MKVHTLYFTGIYMVLALTYLLVLGLSAKYIGYLGVLISTGFFGIVFLLGPFWCPFEIKKEGVS